MKKRVLSSIAILASLSFGGVAYACDMHGGGGFGMRNAPWQSYNPQVSTTDPAFAETDTISPILIPNEKTKPSFSNAAFLAATKAKARLAKKQAGKKTDQKAEVKKTALNSDR